MRVLLKRSNMGLYIKWFNWEKGKPTTIQIDWTPFRDQATRFWSKDSEFLKTVEENCRFPLVYVLQYGPNHDKII